MRVGCVILAAGNARRFGENKLLARYRGRPLVEWVLEAVPPDLKPAALVTQYPAVAALAAARGFEVLRNDAPELGISRSVALGAAALAGRCEGLLFLAADQPRLSRESLERLAAAFAADPTRIAAAEAGERRGNPAIFPAELIPELRELRGDRGGMQLIRRYPARLRWVPIPPEELADVDTPADLEAL